MPTRSSRAESDIAPTATPCSLIPTSGSVPATTGASTAGPVVGDIDDDADGAFVARIPLLGVAQERPVGAVHDDVRASLEGASAADSQLDPPVELLERIGRHDLGERLVRAVGDATDLLDEVRQGRL